MANDPYDAFGTYLHFFENLKRLQYDESVEIDTLGNELHRLLERDPDNLYGLLCLQLVSIMQGNPPRARDIANKIWSIGGSISPAAEAVYIDNLLDLGLTEMAGVLLKERLADMESAPAVFEAVMLKYAIETGNIPLLTQICTVSGKHQVLKAFADINRNLNNSGHLKNMQRLVLDQTKNRICGFDYQLYTDRGFPEIEVFLYTPDSENINLQLQKSIDDKIAAYYLSVGKPQINNYLATVRNLRKRKKSSY